jgi:universal stress protein A
MLIGSGATSLDRRQLPPVPWSRIDPCQWLDGPGGLGWILAVIRKIPLHVQPYTRILVAVDLTQSSFSIAERGRVVATAFGADLTIIHVVEPLPLVAPIPPVTVVQPLIETQEQLIQAAQQHVARLASEQSPQPARWRVEVGNVKTELLRVAQELEVDLIVLGSHGRHGLAVIFGPTEDAVLHSAPCDVLAVRISD